MPASTATLSPPGLASAAGAAVACAVSGAALEVWAVETAPTEMPEDASARLRFVDVAAEAAAAALSFGTCGATLAVSRPHTRSSAVQISGDAATHCTEGHALTRPLACAQYNMRNCKTPYGGARDL